MTRNERIRAAAAAGRTYQDIADEHGISRQRVDQIIKPLAAKARMLVQDAIDRGTLVRPAECSRCGRGGKVESHHSDYSRPLDVEWLCVRCHRDEHRGQVRRVPNKRLPVPVACPQCGSVRLRKPYHQKNRRGFCSTACSGRASRLTRAEVDGRLHAVAMALREYVAASGRVPTSGQFARHLVGNPGTGATALLVNRIDPGRKVWSTYSAIVDRVYVVAGFARPDGRREPNGYAVERSAA